MKVSFYKFPDDEVIAFFQNGWYECNPGCVMSYMHIGQHGEASRDLQAELKLATQEEYQSLLEELGSIGYENIEVRPVV